MNCQPVVGQQAATGFMETPFSLLTVNTSDLVNGVETFNCAAILDLSGLDYSCLTFDGSITASVNITAYCKIFDVCFLCNHAVSTVKCFHRNMTCLMGW